MIDSMRQYIAAKMKGELPMKNSDMKAVAIILAIALFFTIVTSNAVSIASVIMLVKGNGTVAASSGDAQQGTQQQGTTPSQQQQGGTSSQQQGGTSSQQGTTPSQQGTDTPTQPQGGSDTPAQPQGGNDTPAAPSKTAAEVLQIYTDVMNKAKTDKPAYTKVEYQQLPSDANSRVISEGSGLVGTLLNLVDTLGIMTSKETAEASPEVKEAGSDMKWFPVCKENKGCYLTDASKIDSYDYKENGDIATITIVLKEEQNPEPMNEYDETYISDTGAMFSPLSKKDIDETLNGGTVQAVIKNVQYNLTYHDCTAILEYNTKTNEIVSITQYMNVAIQGSGKILGVKQITIDRQELINTMICKDFTY